ncbi:MAG: SHOCT domain-containing protein [Actinomycetota bacterium]|nr:SHOCT domain-containing protein [Actinomycetota bacterium]
MDCACSMGIGSMTWMMLLPALFLVALVIGGIALVRRLWPDGVRREDESALRILEERYARGEIDRDEFDDRREHLRS